MRILLLGGSKSGKSMLAQRLVRALSKGSNMYYLAAMEPTDTEDELRIKKHIEDRAGWGFETLECAKNIASCLPLFKNNASVLFDSLTALLANETFGTASSGYHAEPDSGAAERVERDIIALSSSVSNFVLVCDEIFRDGESYDEASEGYRRALAKVCRTLAAEFDAVCEVTAGAVKVLKGSLADY